MSDEKKGAGDAYRVGPGNPPRENQFKKGTSGNIYGRPKRSKRLLSSVQELMDITRVMESPVTFRQGDVNVTKSTIVSLLEVLRAKALGGHGPSLRFLINLYRDAIKEIELRYPQLTKEIAVYHQELIEGIPANWVTGELNHRGDILDQVFKTPNKDRTWRSRGRKRADIK